MKFKDYKYERPNIDEVINDYKKAITEMQQATSATEQVAIIEKLNKIRMNFSTMNSLCLIRNSINTKDEFYEKEQNFFDENSPILAEYDQEFNLAIFNSHYQDGLKAKYGDHIFNLIATSLKTFKPEIISDLQEENKLVTEYNKLLASAQIPFDGKTLTLSQLSPYAQSKDRTVRKAAENAAANFYEENEANFDDIYDKLVHVRTAMAQKLGFKNYVELGYARLGRTDYNAEMVKNYRKQVYNDLLPIVKKYVENQGKRLGISEMKSYDLAINCLSGNPKPAGTTAEKVANANKMYHEMSKETGVFFDFMCEHELFDLDAKPGKQGGGYCTIIPDYESPFIFANFNGTSGDVDVLTHEAGHAFQVFSSRGAMLPEYVWPTLEACEIHSMSMEFFAWPWMELFFGNDAERYRFFHLEDSIRFIPYGVSVDEFQHQMYEHPEMSKDERKATWHDIEQKYTPYKVFENEFLNKGTIWYRQSHIFQTPFYYIDYTLAQVCAHQFFIKNQENHEKAWQDYYHLCCLGGSMSFLNLIKAANLDNPFVDGTIKRTAEKLDKWLESFDKSILK